MIDQLLITNEGTPLNSPRTGVVGTSTNIIVPLICRPSNRFLQRNNNLYPAISQEWSAVMGVVGVSGTLR
jgi:hypothetical protein